MKNSKNMAKAGAAIALVLNLTACGTILHPERKGQIDGRIDAGIAVLDGVGLLFFIIPGVIAYAVDFSNGTIYLPGTGKGKGKKAALRPEELRRRRFDLRREAAPQLEAILSRETGREVRLDEARGERLGSTRELAARFAQLPAAL